MNLEHDFTQRADRIPWLGTGLSVDVYTPDLFTLARELDRENLSAGYFEIFKAPLHELSRIKDGLIGKRFAYHAEGVWLTEPEMFSSYPWREAVDTVARHTSMLGAVWANHECASKQFAGYSFGTYLPPLFTTAAARITAANTILAQSRLDDWYTAHGQKRQAPMLLLEVPPLTYFGFGNLKVANFFGELAGSAPCGLVLDIGHLWTIWRYRERRHHKNLETFVSDFVETFPMHRIVQIHIAGLGSGNKEPGLDSAPLWVDAHDAPVPSVLFDVLRQVLAQRDRLTNLKAIALEVDNKALPLILQEFRCLLRDGNVGELNLKDPDRRCSLNSISENVHSSPWDTSVDSQGMSQLYETYARAVSGQAAWESTELAVLAHDSDAAGLTRYTEEYLTREIIHWGGDLTQLFPEVWRVLHERGLSVHAFVKFWYGCPRSVHGPYDFFYIKLEQWGEFIRHVAPDLYEGVASTCEALRALHAELNDETSGRAAATAQATVNDREEPCE